MVHWEKCAAEVPCRISLYLVPYFNIVDAVVPPWLGDAMAWAVHAVEVEVGAGVRRVWSEVARRVDAVIDSWFDEME
jgi:hypothetical protein